MLAAVLFAPAGLRLRALGNAQSGDLIAACQVVGFRDSIEQIPAVLRSPVQGMFDGLENAHPDAPGLLELGHTLDRPGVRALINTDAGSDARLNRRD